MLYQRATAQDAAELLHLFQACTQDLMDRRGYHNWSSWLKQDAAWMAAEIEKLETYLVLDQDAIIATFSIQLEPQPYYDMNLWRSAHDKAIYLRRLAVLPTYQENGVGGWCLAQFEALAKARGYSAIRFDAYWRNLELLAFYDKRGYQRCGELTLNAERDLGVVCFEKGL